MAKWIIRAKITTTLTTCWDLPLWVYSQNIETKREEPKNERLVGSTETIKVIHQCIHRSLCHVPHNNNQAVSGFLSCTMFQFHFQFNFCSIQGKQFLLGFLFVILFIIFAFGYWNGEHFKGGWTVPPSPQTKHPHYQTQSLANKKYSQMDLNTQEQQIFNLGKNRKSINL